jgi:Mediator complex subunit 15
MQQMGQQNLGFPPQLQHQMQASPIPPSLGQPMGMNVNPALNMQAAGGGPGGRGMQQPNSFMQSQQPRPNQQMVQIKMTPEDNEAINRIAQQMAATTSPEDRRKIQQNLQNMPADQLQNIKAKGVDPMAAYFRDRATKEWRRQQQGLGVNPNFNANMQMYPAAQAQRPGQTPANMPKAQGSRGMLPNGQSNGQPAGTPFPNNLDHFQGLQADGLRSQEQGQLVVPASNGQGINPEQFRLQQFVNNKQMAKQNAGGRGSQPFVTQQPQPTPMQQAQGLQQAQQETTNNAAGNQARARAEAAARAQQQLGMQNQQGLQGMSQSGTPLSMLTRPVGMNGQGPAQAQAQPQGTPQPRPPSRVPNPGQQPTSQMQQSFPQAEQQSNNQQAATQAQVLAGLPQQLQQLLRKHPQQQWREIIERFKQQAMRQSRFQPGAPQMSQTLSQPGQMAQAPNNQLLGDGAMTSLPMQHSASVGAPGAQAPNQGMHSTQQVLFQQRRLADANRPHATQMPNQQAPLSVIQQGNMLPDLPEHSIANMDQQPIPQQLYLNIVQKLSLPGHIKTWLQLKQHLSQHPHEALPMEKILSVQKLQFQQMVQWMQNRNRPIGDQNRPMSVQPGSGPQPSSQMPPNMQDPRLQGVPQQNQMSMNMIANLPPISAEEIQRARMSTPQLAQLSDQQVKIFLTQFRENEARKRLGQAQQAQNAQQITFMPGQTPTQPPQLGPPRPQQQQQHPAGTNPAATVGQTPQMRPGMAGPRPQTTPNPRPASQTVPPPQPTATNQQSGKPMKRSGGANEVIEIPNPNLGPQSALPQPAGSGPSGPQSRVLSKEEISRLPPDQQKAYRERQSHHQQSLFIAHIARLTDEVRRTSPGLHPLALDPPSRARIVNVLTAPATKQMLTRFNVFLYQYFLMTKNSDQVKQLLSYKMHLFPQYTQASVKAGTWEPADQFGITADYAETAVKDLLARFNHVMTQVGPQPPAINPASSADAAGSLPLSADNLKKHQDMQAEQRAKRPAQDVPPAPTASRPPFTFNDASPRGQGTPRYAPVSLKQGLQQEDLRLPSKRQKKTHQDNAALTPTGGHGTPATSPQKSKVKKPEELPFKCVISGCEFKEKGFATKHDLDDHSNTAHRPVEEPIADPLAFFLESLRDGLGLDENGEPKVKPKTDAPKAPEMQKTISKPAGLGSKPPTPAPSSVTMARGVSSASGAKGPSPNPSQRTMANGRLDRERIGQPSTTRQAWNNSHVSLSQLQSTFGDLVSGDTRTSINHHDPLRTDNDVGDFMDQFMESEAWTKMQETAVNAETASSKATESPAQQSDRGQGSSDISKGDEVFIKIDADDTELAESWALPELQLDPVGGAEGVDEADEWMKMDFGDASTSTADVDIMGKMDFEWKEVDWDKLLAEQDKAVANSTKK